MIALTRRARLITEQTNALNVSVPRAESHVGPPRARVTVAGQSVMGQSVMGEWPAESPGAGEGPLRDGSAFAFGRPVKGFFCRTERTVGRKSALTRHQGSHNER